MKYRTAEAWNSLQPSVYLWQYRWEYRAQQKVLMWYLLLKVWKMSLVQPGTLYWLSSVWLQDTYVLINHWGNQNGGDIPGSQQTFGTNLKCYWLTTFAFFLWRATLADGSWEIDLSVQHTPKQIIFPLFICNMETSSPHTLSLSSSPPRLTHTKSLHSLSVQ